MPKIQESPRTVSIFFCMYSPVQINTSPLLPTLVLTVPFASFPLHGILWRWEENWTVAPISLLPLLSNCGEEAWGRMHSQLYPGSGGGWHQAGWDGTPAMCTQPGVPVLGLGLYGEWVEVPCIGRQQRTEVKARPQGFILASVAGRRETAVVKRKRPDSVCGKTPFWFTAFQKRSFPP